jgi:hypothetical protein
MLLRVPQAPADVSLARLLARLPEQTLALLGSASQPVHAAV